MDQKCQPPDQSRGEKWIDATSWQSPAISLPNPQDDPEVETVHIQPIQPTRWPFEDDHFAHDIQQRMRAEHAARNTQLTVEAKLDRLLIKLIGREPLSTLVAICGALLIVFTQDDFADVRGWVNAAVVTVLGRMMNERR